MSERLQATLHEVDTIYSIDDAADAHDALDWFDALEIDSNNKSRAQHGAR